MLTDSPLARIHYLVRARVEQAPQPWRSPWKRVCPPHPALEDECTAEMLRATAKARAWCTGAPALPRPSLMAYREDFSAPGGGEDADMLTALSRIQPLAVQVVLPPGRRARHVAFEDLQHRQGGPVRFSAGAGGMARAC